jgi:threonine dehydrogenase-like Zn-dependent dehydrogenase
MKAVWFPARDAVEVGALPDPVAGPGEVVVAVRASGICHTDFEVMRANYGEGAFPVVPGHEYAGEIAEIGAGVTGLAIGDRVVIDPNLECGECRACRRGWAHLCEKLGAYGVTVHGGFAERSVVKAEAVHPIGDLSFTAAALAEPMGCVLNGLSPLEGRIVERALVFGTGPMGLLLGLALRTRGAAEVLMVDTNLARLEMAAGFGLDALEAGSERLADLRHGCDLVVDATGVPAVAAGLIDYAANGGAALFFGVCPQDARIPVSPFEVFRRQLSLFGTHSLNHNIPEALAALAAIGPAAERVATHRLSLDEIAGVFRNGPPAGAMKVQMVC